MRGVALLAAVTLVAEIGDFRRFANPRQLRAYLGLVPCGIFLRQEGRTRAHHQGRQQPCTPGPGRGRLDLAHASARQPSCCTRVWMACPKRSARWPGRRRFGCARYRRLVAKGKPKNLVTTAIAREMAAFAWAIAQHVEPTPAA